ncbi:TPA: hypothetical protein ACSTLU_004353 [Serratia fonticola]
MLIPTLFQPSSPRNEINFRAPTVDDALQFSGASTEQEEQTTTKYLDAMQVGDVQSSAKWTAQDRRTALWWIYTHSQSEGAYQTLSYQCAHCNELHHYDFDMADLADQVELLTVPPYVEVEIPVRGVPYLWHLKPLDGVGMEHLEMMYSNLPAEDDPDYKKELANLKVVEITLQAHLADQPDDFQKAAEMRYELIRSMDINSEFVALAANVRKMKETLHHGLPIKIHKGQSQLYVKPHDCPTLAKEDKTVSTRLFFQFRGVDYLPGNVAQLLGDPD